LHAFPLELRTALHNSRRSDGSYRDFRAGPWSGRAGAAKGRVKLRLGRNEETTSSVPDPAGHANSITVDKPAAVAERLRMESVLEVTGFGSSDRITRTDADRTIEGGFARLMGVAGVSGRPGRLDAQDLSTKHSELRPKPHGLIGGVLEMRARQKADDTLTQLTSAMSEAAKHLALITKGDVERWVGMRDRATDLDRAFDHQIVSGQPGIEREIEDAVLKRGKRETSSAPLQHLRLALSKVAKLLEKDFTSHTIGHASSETWSTFIAAANAFYEAYPNKYMNPGLSISLSPFHTQRELFLDHLGELSPQARARFLIDDRRVATTVGYLLEKKMMGYEHQPYDGPKASAYEGAQAQKQSSRSPELLAYVSEMHQDLGASAVSRETEKKIEQAVKSLTDEQAKALDRDALLAFGVPTNRHAYFFHALVKRLPPTNWRKDDFDLDRPAREVFRDLANVGDFMDWQSQISHLEELAFHFGATPTGRTLEDLSPLANRQFPELARHNFLRDWGEIEARAENAEVKIRPRSSDEYLSRAPEGAALIGEVSFKPSTDGLEIVAQRIGRWPHPKEVTLADFDDKALAAISSAMASEPAAEGIMKRIDAELTTRKADREKVLQGARTKLKPALEAIDK
jgi:hypothetical protein